MVNIPWTATPVWGLSQSSCFSSLLSQVFEVSRYLDITRFSNSCLPYLQPFPHPMKHCLEWVHHPTFSASENIFLFSVPGKTWQLLRCNSRLWTFSRFLNLYCPLYSHVLNIVWNWLTWLLQSLEENVLSAVKYLLITSHGLGITEAWATFAFSSHKLKKEDPPLFQCYHFHPSW